MGRNYYCEYCKKIIKNNLNVRKNHMDGLPHNIAKEEYLQQFRDPQEILLEELKKRPCERFLKGKKCRFSILCHFSHYTQKQLNQLKRIINKKKVQIVDEPSFKKQQIQRSVIKNQELHKVSLSLDQGNDARNIWNYPLEQNQQIYFLNIPLSVQPIIVEKIPLDLSEWGTKFNSL